MSERIQLCGEIPEPRHWPLTPLTGVAEMAD